MRSHSTATSLLSLSCLLLNGTAIHAQSVPGTPARTAAAVQPAPPASAAANELLDGTPVKLRLSETVSSATARTGEEVPFEVVEDVQVGGVTVIRKGATALATVTEAEHKKTMGRGGKLDVNIDSVRLVDNEKAQLRATAGGKAGGHTGAMTGAMVATSILFFPAAPLFLFMHGKDITLEKGLETTAFVEGDMHLNLAAFTPGEPAAPNQPSAAVAGLSNVAIDASAPDCEIDVDGSFVGDTPSAVAMVSGHHTIVVRKAGYADWTKTLTVSGGSIHLHADMLNAAEK